MSDYDVVIAGGGHNGLVCGAYLSLHGLKVLVAERNDWVGGGAVTAEITLPGFKHDLFGASHVWCHVNPDFREILRPELEKNYGLKYLWAEDEISGHPQPEGPGIIIYKSVDKTCDRIAQYSSKDARRYREIFNDFKEIEDGFVKGFFSPPNPPSYHPAAMENSEDGLRMLRDYHLSAANFVGENFENTWVQAAIHGWAMGPHVKPDQEGMGASFYIMIPAMHVYGQSIPEGGSMQLPLSCKRLIEDKGGAVLMNSTIEKFIIANGECQGIRLEDGTEIIARQAVITALDPKQSFLQLTDAKHLDDKFIRMCQNFRFGDIGIFRVHYALNEAPDYRHGGDMNKVAFHRIFGPIQDIINHFAEVDKKQLPVNPFIHCLCWTKKDPTRAPEGKHCLTIDTFPPTVLADGVKWDDVKEEFAQVLLGVLRQHTSNMGDDNILDYKIHTPEDLYAYNRSFYKGSPTGGERIMAQLGFFRPFPGYSQYKSPINKLYMTGPSCHPGGGISAMGTITAKVLLRDLGMIAAEDSDEGFL
jgi:phytoene dehydrogenase-like protein